MLSVKRTITAGRSATLSSFFQKKKKFSKIFFSEEKPLLASSSTPWEEEKKGAGSPLYSKIFLLVDKAVCARMALSERPEREDGEPA